MAMKKVGIFSRIYREETTVIRAIESILNQTYRHIKVYFLVNEKTYDLVNEYKKNDNRIEIIKNENDLKDIGFVDYMYKISRENDFICTLDADDWYENDFIKTMLDFSSEYNLDLVGCGSAFETKDNNIVAYRYTEEIIIWENKDFPIVFSQIFQFFRPLWGKLFSSKLFTKDINERLPKSEERGGYAGDTILGLLIAKNANKLGILNEIKHHYTVSEKGNSYRWLKGRIYADDILHNFLVDFLKSFDFISDYNSDFLYRVYGNGLNDTIVLMKECFTDANEIISNLKKILNNPTTEEYLEKYDFFNLKTYIYDYIFKKNKDILLEQKEDLYEIFIKLYRELEGRIKIEEFLLISNSVENLSLLVEKNYDELFGNLLEYKENIEEEKICISILKKITDNSILINLLNHENGFKFAVENKSLILKLKNKQYEDLKKYLREELYQISITSFKIEIIIELYIYLSAITEDIDKYIEGKAMMLELYYKLNKHKEYNSLKSELDEMGVEITF